MGECIKEILKLVIIKPYTNTEMRENIIMKMEIEEMK